MNVALRRAMTVAEYLAWGDTQGERQRTELINGQVVAMAPERVAHNRIKIRALQALERALLAGGIEGEVFIDGITAPIEAHTAYEPDVLVRLGAPLDADHLKVTDPVILVEVLSANTAHNDKSAKLIGYFTLPSVLHYLVIDPEGRTIAHHARERDGGIGVRNLSSGALIFDPPGIAVEVAEIFDGRSAG